jgi:hypothetical protein
MRESFIKTATVLLVATLFATSLISCQSTSSDSNAKDQRARISGTWLMTARMLDGSEVPVTERVMRLALNSDGTFYANYRGEMNQDWILAGQGAYSYEPPLLNLYWDSGRVINLLVDESQPEKLVLHHGRNAAPLKDQEPDEIFVRHKGEKGPTR